MEEGRQLVRRSLALLDGPTLAGQDTRAERVQILGEVAFTVPKFGDERAQRRRLHEERLALSQELGDQYWMTAAMRCLASNALWMGELDRARQGFFEVLTRYRALGDQMGIGFAYEGLGDVALRRSRFDEAETWFRRALEAQRQLGDALSIQKAGSGVADALILQGKLTEALEVLEELVTSFGYVGHMAARMALELGYARLHVGDYDGARACGEESLRLSSEWGPSLATAYSRHLLGRVALGESGGRQDAGTVSLPSEDGEAKVAYAETNRLLQEGIAVMREAGDPDDLARHLVDLGVTAFRMGEPKQAHKHLWEALGIAAETGMRPLLLRSLCGIALLLAGVGERERAIELYALASRYPFVANSRWFYDVFGRHIDAIAATLPPEVAEAARERGRARDLQVTVKELLSEFKA